MDVNVLSALRVQTKENVVTNLLSYCVNASPVFARVFLSTVCHEHNPERYSQIQAATRVATAQSGVPDLLIVARDGNAADLFLVENKLKADEGVDQTLRYASDGCVRDVQRRLDRTAEWRETRFVFLTLFPDQEPQSPRFERATYADLLADLQPESLDGGPLV